MMYFKQLARLGFALLALLTACSPAPQTATPVASTPTLLATITPALPTPTVQPVALVGGSVPCFAGPQVDDNIVSMLEINDNPPIVGPDYSGEFWTVERKDGKGYCWAESKYVTVQGDPGKLAVVVPTGTPIPPVPPAPTNLRGKPSCKLTVHNVNYHGAKIQAYETTANVTLDWDDVEAETGYRVYRDKELVAELRQDETHYEGVIATVYSRAAITVIYSVRAFSAAGDSVEATLPVVYACGKR